MNTLHLRVIVKSKIKKEFALASMIEAYTLGMFMGKGYNFLPFFFHWEMH